MARENVGSIRRIEILSAAAVCFARSGFHQTTVHEICAELGMSPGNLYNYFLSKEDIIKCIVENNLKSASKWFDGLETSSDLMAFLELMAKHYLEDPHTHSESSIWVEIKAESRRNPVIAQINEQIDSSVRTRISAALQSAVARGQLSPDLDIDATVYFLMALADGLFWRRVVDPKFSAERVLPFLLELIKKLLLFPIPKKNH